MALTVSTLMKPPGDPLFYELGFRTIIETHLFLLRLDALTLKQVIDGSKVHQYEGDFYGLLSELNIPMEHHWICLRVNNMFNPNEFGRSSYNLHSLRNDFTLKIPSDDYIRQLAVLYKSTRR